MRFFERLFEPYADADGPPPDRLGAFILWAIAGARGTVMVAVLFSLLSGAAEAGGAWLVGWVVDRVADSDPERFLTDHGWALAAAVIFFVVLRPAILIVSSALTSLSLGPGLLHLSIWRLHRHTLGQSLKFFEDDFAGRLSQKEMQTATSLADGIVEIVHAVTFAGAAVIASAVVLGAVDIRLALVLGGWLVLYGALIHFALPRIRRRSRERAEARAALSGQLVDTLSHMQTVKLFAHAGWEEAAAMKAIDGHRAASLAFGREAVRFRAGLATLSGLLPVALIGAALWLWQAGQATPGVIAIAAFLSLRIGQMSGWVSFTAMAIFAHVGQVEDGMRTLARAHNVTDAPDAAPDADGRGRIAFEKVEFRYGKDAGGGLNGFDLTIEPGEKVALVGRSGAGKSTALALLTRLYDVEGGRVAFNDVDVRDLSQDALRREIALVTQETALFNRPALDNILYGRPEAGEAAAIDAAKRASAHEFIQDLRDFKGRKGYGAYLGERGVKLSGGQRQRIALARVILKDAPVLLLDEATAALDSETEAAVQAALAQLMEGRTVIAVAHRLSTIARMDRIVVMENGRIAEQGTHEALLAAGGRYASFWSRQSGGFIGADLAAE